MHRQSGETYADPTAMCKCEKSQTSKIGEKFAPLINLRVDDIDIDSMTTTYNTPGRVAQSVGHLTRKSEVLGSIPGLATYFRFSFRFFKKGSCQLLAKVCARSTG